MADRPASIAKPAAAVTPETPWLAQRVRSRHGALAVLAPALDASAAAGTHDFGPILKADAVLTAAWL